MRVKLKNELGISTTLPTGEQCFHVLGHGKDILVTCPGPDPAICGRLVEGAKKVFLLRIPDFDDQMPRSWHEAIPARWESVSLEKAERLMPEVRVVHYAPATRLFPSVYAPLLARLSPLPAIPTQENIWLPGPDNGLLIPDLALAASSLGLASRKIAARISPFALARLLEQERPKLFLSVNFHGLDPYGENQALLEEAGVNVAVWCVDNPLHLLTNQKNLLWKRLPLFMTDDWFVPVLRDLGSDARHLPLATNPRFFAPDAICPDARDVSFVGRSSFPDRDRFFAACRIPEALALEAEALPGRLAHFGWWKDRLPDVPLWPGNAVRVLGLGAETASAAWRRTCLQALAEATELTIVGDAAWHDLVPTARVIPPVDYYTGLAGIYRKASFSLNLTSLLLPQALTQRHFDVWACGGFLLTDDTPGLRIFPRELTREVTFGSAQEAVERVRGLAAAPRGKEELRHAWQEHILANHTYAHRLRNILGLSA
jgi:hypothetical protein